VGRRQSKLNRVRGLRHHERDVDARHAEFLANSSAINSTRLKANVGVGGDGGSIETVRENLAEVLG